MAKRQIRETDTRKTEDRESILRAIQDDDYRDPMYIPPEIVPPGWVYKWGTHSLLGEPKPEVMMKYRRKGWTPVPASRHPDLAYQSTNADPSINGAIWRGGQVLIERRVEYENAEIEHNEKVNLEALQSMPGQDNYLGDPNLPARDMSQAGMELHRTRGASFAK